MGINKACNVVGVPLPYGKVNPADLAAALREFAETVDAYADGAADGRFSGADIVRLNGEAWDVLQAVAGLMVETVLITVEEEE